MSQSQTSTSLRNTSFHSGGMPTGLAIHEREREEERKRRRAKAKIERQLSDSVGFPLFAEPRKVQPSSEDAIQQQIKVTLPEFETIAPALQHHNHLIGIMRLPQTPVEKKPKAVFNFDTERKDSKSTTELTNANLAVTNMQQTSARTGNKSKEQRHGKSSHDKKINGVVNGTGLSSGGSLHVSKMPDASSFGKSSTLSHAKSPSHSETTLLKSAQSKKSEAKPVINGLLRSQQSGAKDREKETKENVKEFSGVKKKEDSYEKANKASVANKSKPPKLCMPDRNLPSNSAETTKIGSWTEDKPTEPSKLKLLLAEQQETQCEPANVEAIVAEMQKVAPPLTGIHTPIKGAPSVFAFHRNGVQQENSAAGSSVKRKTSENREEKTDELLHNDLMLSDDESDNEHGHRTMSPSKPNRNGRSCLHSSSSSGSSSGESDSDSSDSDSESSCSDTNNNSRNKNSSPANSPLSSPKSASGRNWGLGHFEKTLCPVPTAPTTKTKPSPSSSNAIGGEGLRGNQAAPAPNATLKSCLNSQVSNGISTIGNGVKSPSSSKSSSLAPFAEELLHSPEANHGVDIESITAKLDPQHHPEAVRDSLAQNGSTVKIQLAKGEAKRRTSTAGSKLNANQEKSPLKKGAKLKKDVTTTNGALDTQGDHLISKRNKPVDGDNKECTVKKMAKNKADTKTAGAVITESKESVKPASEGDDEDVIVDVIGDERTPLLDTVKSDSKPANRSKRKEPEKTKVVKTKPSKLTNGLSSHINGEKMFSKLVSPNRTKGPFANDVEITLNEDDKRESLIVKIDLALLKRIPKIPGGSEPVHIKYPASSPPVETNGSWNAIRSPSSTKISKRQSSVEKTAEQESSKKSKLGYETDLSQKKTIEQSNSANSQGSEHTKDTPKKRSPIHDSDCHRSKRQRHDSECSKGQELCDNAGNHDKRLTVENKVGISDGVQQCSCGDQKDNENRDAFIATFYEPSPRVPHGPDHYLAEAKKLKHKADSLNDKESKAFLYIGSVLYFARCGKALEQNEESESRSAHQMYSETLDLLRYTMRSFVSRLNHHTDGGVDKRLAALCMRIQSILYMRLYKLRKEHVMKNVKAVTEHFKGPPKSTQAPSPYTSNAKITGTPSPLSPTPSPSGSVGSVGSVGSTGSNEAVTTPSRNGKQTSAMTSPGNVCIPQKIHSMTAQHVLQANNLLYSHDLWDQSQAIVLEQKDFFMDLDRKCRPLTLHSSIMHMIDYVEQGLKCLKEISKAGKSSS